MISISNEISNKSNKIVVDNNCFKKIMAEKYETDQSDATSSEDDITTTDDVMAAHSDNSATPPERKVSDAKLPTQYRIWE